MRVEFINSTGGKMYVDESRVEEYKGAGYMLASDVIDSTFTEVSVEEKPVKKEKPKSTKKKLED